VYTPSRNIVYHDYNPNPNGLGMDWNRPRGQKMRMTSLERIKSFLHIDGAASKSDLANLGIYGLGKRRSLAQLMDFVGIDSNKMKFDKENAT
jgi:Glycosyltransferase (GlcNAc)